MALSTIADIRSTGGIDHAADHRLFRLIDDAELDDQVERAQSRAVAYMRSQISVDYYTGSVTDDLDLDETMRGAEELFALHFLYLRLKARHVFGTHAPFVQEDSARFAELIDTELLAQAQLLIGPYLTIDTAGSPSYALPVFMASNPVDRSTVPVVDLIYQENLDEANGLIGATTL